jgi:NADPH:quinone reductase-like Zn-dependent oxidoreductase
MSPLPFPGILGWDVAGTVNAVGPGGSARQVGDPVVAMWDQHFVAAGSYAEVVTLDAGPARAGTLQPGLGDRAARSRVDGADPEGGGGVRILFVPRMWR